MKNRKMLLITGAILSCLLILPSYSLAKNDKDKDNEKNHASSASEKHSSLPGYEKNADRGNKKGLEVKIKKQDRSNNVRSDKSHYAIVPPIQPPQSQKHLAVKNEVALHDLQKALDKLKSSRWSYNPNDERGQGNMGKPDMLAPFGHDKDSDRKELYGNRGRVIRVVEPEPTPEPPPPEPEPEPEPPPPEPEPEPEPEPTPEPEPPPEPEPLPQPPF